MTSTSGLAGCQGSVLDGSCIPACEGRECAFGTCNAGGQCAAECVPNCASKVCGNDGCGGSCGTCSSGNCNANGQCVTSTGRPQIGDRDAKGRALVWAEEFDGPQINRAVWGNETGMVRNNEQQCYTTDAKNQFIESGSLVIRGIPETACTTGHYTSASLTIEGHQSFQYGRLEARIQVPTVKGAWPAFWLLPWNKATYGSEWWPAGGEIDVMEVVSQNSNLVHGAAHYQQGGGRRSSSSGTTIYEPLSAAYHVFAIEWTATQIEWYLDSTRYFTVDTTQNFDGWHPFQDSFYVILNFAIGGDWPEAPNSALYPADMRVDWVRYWK